jgi:hypothetical protein
MYALSQTKLPEKLNPKTPEVASEYPTVGRINDDTLPVVSIVNSFGLPKLIRNQSDSVGFDDRDPCNPMSPTKLYNFHCTVLVGLFRLKNPSPWNCDPVTGWGLDSRYDVIGKIVILFAILLFILN